jgi:trk system potassium uptake protein
MAESRQVAVLGLGRFGQAIARELAVLGHDVLAVDASEKEVRAIADDVTHAVQADVTDRETLERLGLAEMDAVVVGIAGSLETSILATVLLRRMGARRIIARAADDLHGSILAEIGADRVVYPEQELGVQVAHSFAAPGVEEYLDVGPGYGVARVRVGPGWDGATLGALDLPRTCGVTVVALARRGGIVLDPGDGESLRSGDALIVAGRDEDLERLPSGRLGGG